MGLVARRRWLLGFSRTGPGKIRTYDELIEGTGDDEIGFPDNMEIVFEIPKEIEEFEL